MAPRSISITLLLLIVASIALSVVTMPLLKATIEAALPGPLWLQKATRYRAIEPGYSTTGTEPASSYSWDLGRVSRRWLLLVTVAVFVATRRWIPWTLLARHGFRRPPGWRRQLQFGVAAGVLMAGIYEVMLLLSGHMVWNDPTIGLLASRFLPYLVGAVLIALLEELFFRAVLFRSMLRDWGTAVAVVASSAVFAVLHCISGYYRVPPGWDPTIGLTLLKVYYTSDAGSFIPDLRLIVGMFLLGILVSLLYLRTGTVWAAVGLHGTLVFASRMLKKVWIRTEDFPEWLLGDRTFLVTGVATWPLLILAIGAVLYLAPKGPLYRHLNRQSSST